MRIGWVKVEQQQQQQPSKEEAPIVTLTVPEGMNYDAPTTPNMNFIVKVAPLVTDTQQEQALPSVVVTGIERGVASKAVLITQPFLECETLFIGGLPLDGSVNAEDLKTTFSKLIQSVSSTTTVEDICVNQPIGKNFFHIFFINCGNKITNK